MLCTLQAVHVAAVAQEGMSLSDSLNASKVNDALKAPSALLSQAGGGGGGAGGQHAQMMAMLQSNPALAAQMG